MISSSERRFVREGAEEGVRYDGRGVLDLRNLQIETDVFVSANGSSRVSRPFTGARVDCAVKIEMLRSSTVGKVEASIDCSALENSAEMERQRGALQVELTAMLCRIFTPESLCVIEKESNCSKLFGAYSNAADNRGIYVDVIVAGTDGNLGDLIYVAVYAAMYDLQKPVLSVFTHEGTSAKTFEVDPHKTEKFVKNLPSLLHLRVTLYELAPNVFVTDASGTEESCAGAAFSAVISKDKRVCATSMMGAIELEKISKVLTTCIEIAAQLFKLLDEELEAAPRAPMVQG